MSSELVKALELIKELIDKDLDIGHLEIRGKSLNSTVIREIARAALANHDAEECRLKRKNDAMARRLKAISGRLANRDWKQDPNALISEVCGMAEATPCLDDEFCSNCYCKVEINHSVKPDDECLCEGCAGIGQEPEGADNISGDMGPREEFDAARARFNKSVNEIIKGSKESEAEDGRSKAY